MKDQMSIDVNNNLSASSKYRKTINNIQIVTMEFSAEKSVFRKIK